MLSGQLERIRARRIHLATAASRRQTLSDAAIEALGELHRRRTARNLRTTLGVAQAALVSAVDRGAELIDEQDVARARDRAARPRRRGTQLRNRQASP
ncbi:MAG TPA: hypothetical protein VG325_09025 [Solirubrobacteraceae bacterium]|nr:hypothetical protein [Solirubrobacteraceae bacterium]